MAGRGHMDHAGRVQGPGPQEFLDERDEFIVSLGHRDPPPRPSDPSVLILSETELVQCIRYRINNKLETFSARGIRSEFCDPRDLYRSIPRLQFYSVLMFYRQPMGDLFMIYHDEARRLGLTIAYDLDDPTFDKAVLGANPNLKAIEPHFRENQLREATRFRQALEVSDFLIASTPHLADLMRRASGNPNVFVWRNAADQFALDAGAKART